MFGGNLILKLFIGIAAIAGKNPIKTGMALALITGASSGIGMN